MNILFTGASSFTGMWFVKELASQGHTITTIFPRNEGDYTGIRQTRMLTAKAHSNPVFSCRFGSDEFLSLIKTGPWDLLCHHAADVTDYKNPDFNVAQAVESNTYRLTEVLDLLQQQGCEKILLTGSVFEQQEGKGDNLDQAVSPYGYSKGVTSEVFRFACEEFKSSLGKFVIPNPFGPFEEKRFTTYLASSWLAGNVPEVSFPDYVRDNIHVSLLAKVYADAANKMDGFQQWNPSGYCESQGEFTTRFAREMEQRLSLPCRYKLCKQKEFNEPKTRINTQPVGPETFQWDESEAWDALAHYYKTYYG